MNRERQYSASMFLNNATMNMVHGMRTQLLSELQVSDSSLTFGRAPTVKSQSCCSTPSRDRQDTAKCFDVIHGNLALGLAVLVSGLLHWLWVAGAGVCD